MTVSRGHVEVLDGDLDGLGNCPVEVKLGTWISNTETRRAKPPITTNSQPTPTSD